MSRLRSGLQGSARRTDLAAARSSGLAGEAWTPFWISISERSRFRRIHRAGGCHIRQEDCKCWEGVEELAPGVADAHCKLCWAPAERVGLQEVLSSSESSSSSSDEGAGDAEQRAAEVMALGVFDEF